MKFKRAYHQDDHGRGYVTIETPKQKIQFELAPRLADVVYFKEFISHKTEFSLLRDRILYPIVIFSENFEDLKIGHLFASDLNCLEGEFGPNDTVVPLENSAKIYIRS